MIATILCYGVTILLTYFGLFGLYLIATTKQKEAAAYLCVSLVLFAMAYGCARLGGI